MPFGLSADVNSKLHASKITLSLSDTLKKVWSNDLSLARFDIAVKAFRDEGDAEHYLHDPTLFVAAQNLPTDTFDVDQEAMTQFRVGIRQKLHRGDDHYIKKEMSDIDIDIQYSEKKSHWRQLKLNTESAWLEAWYWQKSRQLIEEDRVFLTQVQDFIQSLYQVGAKDQSDLIGAELELMKLSEKRIVADSHYRAYRNKLNTLASEKLVGDQLNENLVDLRNLVLDLTDSDFLMEQFLAHPDIQQLDERVNLMDKKVSLAKEYYKPSWELEVSYGFRDGDNNDGSDRADLLSAGVSVQLPLFTKGKQDKVLSAEKYRKSAAENKRLEAIKKMRFQFENVYQQYLTAVEQRALYEQKILPTLHLQKQSALQSYESDKGDFRTVTDLFSKEQNAKIKHQRLRVNEQLMMAKLNYWIGTDQQGMNMGLNRMESSGLDSHDMGGMGQ